MANKKINQLVSKTAILSTDIFGIGDATTGQLFKKTIAELQAAIGGAVISVNGLVGTVVLDTDDIQELATPTNKYFTDARARGAISLTVTGNSGASTYSSGTGVLNVPTYTLAGLGGISATFLSGTSGISYNSGTGVISYSGTVYTDASIRALLSAGTGITYNSSTGAISYSGTVYTDSSVRALISITTTGDSGASTYNNTTGVINVPNYTLAGLGGISYTSLSGGTGITYNNTTGAISYSGTVYTDASVRALISATGNISYNSTTGVISTSLTQYTDALARASVSLTTTGTSGASTYNSTTGVFNIPQYQAVLTNPVTGTGTTNYVAKFTSSSAIGNSLIFDNGTNVGINTATPTAKLEIYDNSNSGILRLSRDAGGQRGALEFGRNNGGSFQTCGSIIVDSDPASVNNGLMYFYTSNSSGTNTERIRITAAGYVGINTTTPATFLHVIGANTSNRGQLCIQSNDGNNAAAITFYYSTTKVGNIGSSSSDIGIESINDMGFYTGGAERMRIKSSGNIEFAQSRAILTTAASGYLALYGNGGGLYFGGSDANQMFLASGGNLNIGYASDAGYKLYVNGTIYATGNITANSDLTLKKNLTIIDNPTDKLMQLNGYSYQWKSDDSHQYGVIAQEVEKILPYAVSTGNDGIKGVSYNQIIPVLIEAVKEQKAKIENLEILLASK
jgi:hypothetical protein